MIQKFIRIIETVRYIKPVQVLYQVNNRINPAKRFSSYFANRNLNVRSLKLSTPVYDQKSWIPPFTFRLLNIEEKFYNDIPWSIDRNGKLWNYNLQYLHYLHQPDVDLDAKIGILKSIYGALHNNVLLLEPYPVSLRTINIIRFIHDYELHSEEWLLKNLYAELNYLTNHFEYHLLGNHLLENAFSLLMGGAYFQNKDWIRKAENILHTQLQEQIMEDGAHFELSPMYHCIIFYRVLELMDWYQHEPLKNQSLFSQLRYTATIMRNWLKLMKFDNGDIPHFNDSADGIAFPPEKLLQIAEGRSINPMYKQPLNDSGYRSFRGVNYHCKVDVGPIGASYQPGHAHADALSFLLYLKNKPLFVELGTSTYENNERRALERSTAAHNTVEINNRNQSDVWGSFRVGRRAKVKIFEDKSSILKAEHDGYGDVIHQRDFIFADHEIFITDRILDQGLAKAVFHLHIAPGIQVTQNEREVLLDGENRLQFLGADYIRVKDCEIAEGFNQLMPSLKLEIGFRNKLTTKIILA